MKWNNGVVHRVLSMLGAMLLLSSCGGTLRIGQGTTPIIPRATPGIPGAATPRAAGDGVPMIAPSAASSARATVPSVQSAPPVIVTPNAATTSTTTNPTPPPPAPATTPTINPALGSVAIPQSPNMQQRWRDQQDERAVFPTPRTYVSPGYQLVFWFDPVFGSYLPIGELRGEFAVQATFKIKGEWVTSLEMPFNITTKEYGITVPDTIAQRMKNAGITEWAEVFIRKTSDVQPK